MRLGEEEGPTARGGKSGFARSASGLVAFVANVPNGGSLPEGGRCRQPSMTKIAHSDKDPNLS